PIINLQLKRSPRQPSLFSRNKDVKIALQPPSPIRPRTIPFQPRPPAIHTLPDRTAVPRLRSRATHYPLFSLFLHVFAKTRSTSPFLATLAHSGSHKSFVCHSY